MLRRFLLLSFVVTALASPLAAQAPDTVLLHGKIWTGNPQQPEVEALAILGDRISATGSTADIARLADAHTRVVELDGRRVVPGFNDAHTHLFQGGLALSEVQLRDARSAQEMRQRVAAFALTRPYGEWILGGEWDHEQWSPAALPTHELIDDVTRDNPVFVERLDGHSALANRVAMQIAGISRSTPDVPGGVIVRDKNGEPTGVFMDAARNLIQKFIPGPTRKQLTDALVKAEQTAARHGVTSVQILWGGEPQQQVAEELRILKDAERDNTLTLRVELSSALETWKQPAALGITAPFGDPMVRIGGLKDFADGSLGSGTAWLLAPYSDAPASSGVARARLTDAKGMYADAKAADAAGLQVAVHAIGDHAIRNVLDIYQRIEQENGARNRRFRIEHAQILSPQDIPRFAELHVIASMQPVHLKDDGRWTEKRIGTQRSRTAFAFRSLLDSGAILAFGSDWPFAAESMDPLDGIYTAATRRTVDGKWPGGWSPEQKITVAEAVRGFTWGSAYAEFQEKDKGTLAPGMLADLVVISDDIFLAPETAHTARVELTMLGGRAVYQEKK